jgi:hypothetical protein
MPTPPNARPPAIQRRQTQTEQRTGQLERDRIGAGTSFRDPDDVDPNPLDGQLYRYEKASGMMLPVARQACFQQPGVVTVATSPPLDLEWSGVITRVHLRLGTAGSTATTVTLALNGAVIVTTTLVANATTTNSIASDSRTGFTGDFEPRVVIALTDRLVIAITVAGTGAQNLAGWVAL